jgi:hypothetical protein
MSTEWPDYPVVPTKGSKETELGSLSCSSMRTAVAGSVDLPVVSAILFEDVPQEH